jgi:hypothetical protein
VIFVVMAIAMPAGGSAWNIAYLFAPGVAGGVLLAAGRLLQRDEVLAWCR